MEKVLITEALTECILHDMSYVKSAEAVLVHKR